MEENDKEPIDKEPSDKESSDKESSDKESSNKESSDKESLDKETLDKENLSKELKKEMLNMNFYEVKSLSIEWGIEKEQILNIALGVYDNFMKEKEFEKAFKVASRYNFEKNKIFYAAVKEFQRLIAKGDINEAAKWGKKAKNIRDFEINKIIVKGFEDLIESGDVEKAIELFEKFKTPPEIVIEKSRHAFNKACEIYDYYTAAFLGKKFGFSKKRTFTATVREVIKVISLKNIEKFISMNEEFDIFNDLVFEVVDTHDAETLSKEFINMIDDYLDQGMYNLVISVLNKIDILSKKHRNEILVYMIDSIYEKIALNHNRLLILNKVKEASELKDQFELLGSYVPLDVKKIVIEGAQTLHNLYMDYYDYNKAQAVRDDYKLFDENIIENSNAVALKSSTEYLEKTLVRLEFDKSKKVIEDYKISKKNLSEIAAKVILDKLDADGYKDAIEILKISKIDPYEHDIQTKAQKFFDEMIVARNCEAAADVGLYFELDKEETLKIAILAWKEKIYKEDFKEAYKMRNRHKIPSKATNKILKNVYRSNLRENEIIICKTIRKQYDLNISIFLLIIEFIKRLIYIKWW